MSFDPSVNEEARAAISRPAAYSKGVRRVISRLIDLCDDEKHVVRLYEAPSSVGRSCCKTRRAPASFVCHVCKTIWLAPKALLHKNVSPEEMAASLAHQVGLVKTPPRPDEPARDTPEGGRRMRERDLIAWDWAGEFLRADSVTWADLEPVYNAVRADHLQEHGADASKRRA